MARTTWWQYLTGLVPRWMRSPWSLRFVETLGVVADAYDEVAKLAVKASMPGIAPVDAQDEIGEERQIERSPLDTPDSYGAALVAAWEFWSVAGTKDSLSAELERQGFAGAVVLESADLTGYPSYEWAGFVVVIPYTTSLIWADSAWDTAGTYDDGGVWDSSVGGDFTARVARTIQTQKPTETKLRFALAQVNADAELWDWPAGTWDDPGVWADDETIGFVRVA